MKIFNEEEITRVTNDFANKGTWQCPVSFTAGVEYAESKAEDLCIKFAEWLSGSLETMSDVYEINEANKTYKELFEQFLK